MAGRDVRLSSFLTDEYSQTINLKYYRAQVSQT